MRREGIGWRTSSIECLSNGGQPRSDGGKIVAKFAELSQVQRFLGSRACIKRRRGRKIAFKVASPRRGIREGLQSEFLNTFKKLGTRTGKRGSDYFSIPRSLFRFHSTRNRRNFRVLRTLNFLKYIYRYIYRVINLPNCNLL